ncbi:rod shape-determining protein MreC [Janthinobacterium fluminis]|uniref:Cell shape-determining protein MreC n=1 Tax=Janthinobacterium fluminis TaxID=2987524 RepID=A0ABT5K6H9_9BURK|nr:rod shape-determining protein MreC [Janthinobacterium fluminis]MDC8760610.1 rod shape-determining protein MreC [Janthinobacterium fluminis]
MEYSPPPLFKQGASARVKMMVCAGISIGLLLADSQMHALTVLRQTIGTVLYPVQMAALAPRELAYGVGDYFSSLSALEKEVRELKRQQIVAAQTMQQAQMHISENNHLRKLMEAREHIPVKSLMAEILYDARDVYSRKIILDRGIQQGVALGFPVIDNLGVVGQVTRVFPFTSEVTLLTDKAQAIPVQILRSGLRSVAYGGGQSGQLELRFTTTNADIVVGDVVVTSGLDGVYPAGLAVARVTLVESNANGVFGRVICQPLAGIGRNTQLLVLMATPNVPPRPPEEELKTSKKHGKMAPIKDPATAAPAVPGAAIPAAAPPSAAAPAAKPPAAANAPAPRPPAPLAAVKPKEENR